MGDYVELHATRFKHKSLIMAMWRNKETHRGKAKENLRLLYACTDAEVMQESVLIASVVSTKQQLIEPASAARQPLQITDSRFSVNEKHSGRTSMARLPQCQTGSLLLLVMKRVVVDRRLNHAASIANDAPVDGLA